MEGGDANPDRSRSVIKNYPMFNYPVHAAAPAAPHAIPAEEAPAINIDPKKVEAAKASAAKEAAADAKASSLAQKKDIEGHSDPAF